MKRIQDLAVVRIERPVEGHVFLYLQSSSGLPEIAPGNFAQIRIPGSTPVLLRRPFSIHDMDTMAHVLTFYIKIVGEGTRALGSMKAGEKLSVIYPLGNSFTVRKGSRTLLVGGGSGIAPLKLLAKRLRESGCRMTLLFGGSSQEDVFYAGGFEEFGPVHLTTEDGSRGEKGLVTEHRLLKSWMDDLDIIYTCGPEPMMKAVARLATGCGIECEASLENLMACGFGVCLCCTTATPDGNLRVCMEGPVFNTKQLTWQT
jgi:dihydroorotate dehydrogenase electron transfer subunit